MPLSNYALDTYVAPKMSQLTQCNVSDLTKRFDQLHYWVNNFITTAIFAVMPNRKVYISLLNQFRRTQAAFTEYDNGRVALERYIEISQDKKGTSISQYMKALSHFEMFLGQAYQAYLLFRTHFEAYEKGNGPSKLTKEIKEIEIFDNEGQLYKGKLRLFYNFSKHMDARIHKEHYPDEGGVPLWLTNEGLEYQWNEEDRSIVNSFYWLEMEIILTDLAEAVTTIFSALERASQRLKDQAKVVN